MPIYEYRCDNCEHEFETIQKFSDDPLRTCPACKQDALRKKVSMSAFRLKGGGWYETDFKSGGDKKRNLGSDGDGTSVSSPKESGGGESSKSAETASSASTSSTPAAAPSTSKRSGGDAT